jgi:aminoglycoside phosphotransferase (APT) family kinase protein
VHGDLLPGHLPVVDGRLSAVIDCTALTQVLADGP